jgi:hypothetical protein
MSQRSISPDAVRAVLEHGRRQYQRGARIFFLGRKEVRAAAKRGLDLSAHEGLHVVCPPHCDTVQTAYRNHNPARRRHSRRPYTATA